MKMLHQPVMLNEAKAMFADSKLKVFFDGTLGFGGHAEMFLSTHPEIELYIGCDRDPSAIEYAKERLQEWKDKIVFINENFSQVDKILDTLNVQEVDGFFFDLGVSSMQFDQEKRGFSFQKDGPLDMRMNPHDPVSAEEIVNTWPQKELEKVFREYGEDPQYRKHAKIIVRERSKRPIKTTKHLSDLIEKISSRFRKKIHPATQVFQALRICVNKEIESVECGIKHALKRLAVKGKVGVISFHSLEDRVVKNLFKQVTQPIRDDRGMKVQEAAFALLSKKPITPLKTEVKENRRSRSAKYRGAQRVR